MLIGVVSSRVGARVRIRISMKPVKVRKFGYEKPSHRTRTSRPSAGDFRIIPESS